MGWPPKTDMVLERADISIHPGRMDEFLEVLVAEAIPLTQTFSGITSFTALRGEEDADNVMFLVGWQSIEAHLASRPEPAHARFREIVMPFMAAAKTTVHFHPVKTVRPG